MKGYQGVAGSIRCFLVALAIGGCFLGGMAIPGSALAGNSCNRFYRDASRLYPRDPGSVDYYLHERGCKAPYGQYIPERSRRCSRLAYHYGLEGYHGKRLNLAVGTRGCVKNEDGTFENE